MNQSTMSLAQEMNLSRRQQFRGSSTRPVPAAFRSCCPTSSSSSLYTCGTATITRNIFIIILCMVSVATVSGRPNKIVGGGVDNSAQFLEFDPPIAVGETNELPGYGGRHQQTVLKQGSQDMEKQQEITGRTATGDKILPDGIKSDDFTSPEHKSPAVAVHKDVAYLNKSSGGYEIATVDFARVRIPFLIAAWILFASLAKIGFHMIPSLSKIFPESCLLIVVGNVVGILLLMFVNDIQISSLTPNEFFLYMLPPIIFDAGYFMPNRLFFDNIGTILLMAVVGTVFNTLTIGLSLYLCSWLGLFGMEIPILHILLFSSLISAVDPVAVLSVFEEIHVNEILYIVVFGESLLNDAVTVVLYHMLDEYEKIGVENIVAVDYASGLASFVVVAVGGTIIGVIWGLLTGMVTRFTDNVRVIEPIFIFIMAYLAYLNAEVFHMSGIMAVTFCGITMKNYVEANISQKSHTTIKYSLKMLSSSSETIIFMFLGVATVNYNHDFNLAFVLLTILFCVLYRFIGVAILIKLANRFRFNKLSTVDQFVISYGGLRGAVAFALALLINDGIPFKRMFITATICVIYFTVFLQGITIKPLVRLLKVKRADKKKISMNERIHERFMDYMKAGLEDIVGMKGKQTLRERYRRFDTKYLRPHIIRDGQGKEPKIMETFSKLKMKDAKDFIKRNQSLTLSRLSFTDPSTQAYKEFIDKSQESSVRNLDIHELDYNPCKKDMTDAKIHHLLTEELKPRRHRRLSYSRHAVDDRDLTTPVNYKVQIHIRRLLNDPKHHHHHHHHRRSKRGSNGGGANGGGGKDAGVNMNRVENHVSFPEFQENGLAKQLSDDYIYEVMQEAAAEEDNLNNNSCEFTLDGDLDEEDETHSLSRKSNTASTNAADWDDGLTFIAKGSKNLLGRRMGDEYPSADDKVEGLHLRRSYVDDDGEVIDGPSSFTATESVLPWKREYVEMDCPLPQNEFPAWASNKEYLAYNSPSTTFLGRLSMRSSREEYDSCGSEGKEETLLAKDQQQQQPQEQK